MSFRLHKMIEKSKETKESSGGQVNTRSKETRETNSTPKEGDLNVL